MLIDPNICAWQCCGKKNKDPALTLIISSASIRVWCHLESWHIICLFPLIYGCFHITPFWHHHWKKHATLSSLVIFLCTIYGKGNFITPTRGGFSSSPGSAAGNGETANGANIVLGPSYLCGAPGQLLTVPIGQDSPAYNVTCREE